jgi:2-keto-4-pentenoate hydratase/2-oxohepta-3-ene-1,7-dioic acid hydratase in catechol pathway
MKIVVFGDYKRVGALQGEHIIDLNKANAALPAHLDAFIAAGPQAVEAAQRALAKADKAAVLSAEGVKLHAPWAGKRLAMAGGNFADHLAGMNANRLGVPRTDEMVKAAHDQARKRGHWGFWKVLDEVAGDGDDVPYPGKKTEYFDYEGEVAIVIGKRGKDIRAADIRDHVWGVTLSNDWSCRDNGDEPRIVQYNMVKNFDRACSIGPCIAVGEAEFDNIDLETRVNGQVRQSFNSKDMIFTFGEVLEYLSVEFTFVPGDVICGGTAAGTAADRTKRTPGQPVPKEMFLKVGDLVEVSSPQIGKLRNRIV